MIGVVLALTGVAMALMGGAGAAVSYWRMPGTDAGASLSAVCGLIAVLGALTSVVGALLATGRF